MSSYSRQRTRAIAHALSVAVALLAFGCGEDTGSDPIPPDPEGACCESDGSCVLAKEVDCNGDYLGDDTSCDPNPCPQPTGACCLEDGRCEVATEAICQGEYQGDDTTCALTPCDQPAGACCDPGGTCVSMSPIDCEDTGGEYLGNETNCDPIPCRASLCIFGPIDEGVRPIVSEVAPAFHCACPADILYLINSDRGYEAALAWSGKGMAGSYGSFAEPYETPEGRAGAPCLMILHLADNGNQVPSRFDVFIWADEEGQPGAVLGMIEGEPLGPLPPWPLVPQRTQEIFEIEQIPIQGKFWAGVRGAWDPEICSAMMVADLSGESENVVRRGMTNIAPGLGYPEGWQSLEVILGRPAALGISVLVGWCPVGDGRSEAIPR